VARAACSKTIGLARRWHGLDPWKARLATLCDRLTKKKRRAALSLFSSMRRARATSAWSGFFKLLLLQSAAPAYVLSLPVASMRARGSTAPQHHRAAVCLCRLYPAAGISERRASIPRLVDSVSPALLGLLSFTMNKRPFLPPRPLSSMLNAPRRRLSSVIRPCSVSPLRAHYSCRAT